jgi:hypothetical protein
LFPAFHIIWLNCIFFHQEQAQKSTHLLTSFSVYSIE